MYFLEVDAGDIKNQGGNSSNLSIAHKAPVIIGNFRTYVKSVKIRSLVENGAGSYSNWPDDQDGELIYAARWTWNIPNLTFTFLPVCQTRRLPPS